MVDRGIRYIDIRMPDQPYENVDGESELVTNEVPPDITETTLHDEASPKLMTTHLSGHQPDLRSVNVPGDSV